MGFHRLTPEQRGRLRKKRNRIKKKKLSVERKKLDIDEQIAHAICALGMNSILSRHIQNEVTHWICDNYELVEPETVQRVFRRMCNDPAHVINKVKEGRFVRYEIIKLFDLNFQENQPELF